MTFRIVIQPPAKLDIDAAYTYRAQQSARSAERWLAGLEDAIRPLARFPRRCAVAPESDEFAEEIRHLIYGRRRPGIACCSLSGARPFGCFTSDTAACER